MKLLPTNAPRLVIDLRGVSQEVERALRTLMRVSDKIIHLQADVVNFNAIVEYDQAAQPTITSGKFAIWKDSDATSGNPTHYLMYNQDGTTVTFASEETVP